MDDIKDVRLGIRVDTDTKADIDNFCLSHNMTISEVGRKALIAYMDAVKKHDIEQYDKFKNDWNSQ